MPLILQNETTECGIACLAMVAGYFGLQTDLFTLRQKYPASLKGTSLVDIIECANSMGLVGRPVKAELDQLTDVKLPAILHWDFKHFVVLVKVDHRGVVIKDPSHGERMLTFEEVSRSFTGVVLELTPGPKFTPRVEKQTISFKTLLGPLPGLRRVIFHALITAGILEGVGLTIPLFVQLVIDRALVSQDQELVLILSVGFFILAMFRVCLTAIRSWLLIHLGTNVNLKLATNLFRHLLTLSLNFFQKRNVGDIASRFESLNSIQRTLTGPFLESLLDGCMATIVLIVMFFYSPVLAWVVLLTCFVYAIIRYALYGPYRALSEEQLTRSAAQQTHFLETVRGMQAIKINNRENLRRTHWQNLIILTNNSMVNLHRAGLTYQAINNLLFAAENVIVIGSGAYLVINGTLTAGMLVAFIAYKQIFIDRASGLVGKFMEFRLLNLHKERVSDVALSPADEELSCLTRPPQAKAPIVELVNVGFRYAPNEPMILRNINLRIEVGESVAITGPSGCGKSTLLRLILGLMPPTEGQVLIDGIPLSEFGVRHFRDGVGVVMQDDTLFNGTIEENISFFDESSPRAFIEECAIAACVHDDIKAMPMGYRTYVGDMGAALSGGQKQRILLARALYRRPRLLVLDEATSHLDVELEKRFSSSVRKLQLTRVLVAHRPETIATASRVVNL